jgi:tRNA(fMet)-specific endonuclease VapC
MTRLLLDTTFLIDAERGRADLDEAIDDEDDVAIAAITVAELLVGVELASGKRRSSRRAYAEAVIECLPVIPYDIDIARDHADLLATVRRIGQPRGAHDLLIAATARATGRTVVTSDAASFTDLDGVPVRAYRSTT